MNFTDRIAVRLGDPAQRAGVLDEEALAAVVAAGYDADLLAAEGPYSAQFDELRLGFADAPAVTADGVWAVVGSSDRTEAHFTVAGAGGGGPKIDALWRGAVIARVVVDHATITEADITRPAPAEPLDKATATVALAFSPSPPPTSSPLTLPVAAPVLIRDADVSIAQLLADSRAACERLEPLGLERAQGESLPRRASLPVVWILPAELFDDPDWPAAEPGMTPSQARAARRTSAGGWLAAQGIALATVPT